jgi:hypothetical protein
VVFDETNDPQVEQYDLDIVDDEEALCDALQRMVIGDVRPHDPTEPQASYTPNDTTSPTQDHDQDQEDEHEDEQKEPQDQDHDQDDSNDQRGDKDDGDHERSRTKSPHSRVHQTVQQDHPMDNILSYIKNGVTIRSRVSTFCQYYLFISSLEPFKVEDSLYDLD